MAVPSYYDVLGITINATDAEIKKAHRRTVKKYHPDLNDSSQAQEMFKMVQEAYETLIDMKLRNDYDFMLEIREAQEAEKRRVYQQTQTRPTKEDSQVEKQSQDLHKGTVIYKSNSKKLRRRLKNNHSFMDVLRTIVRVVFLLLIPAYSFYINRDFNWLILYYGWIIAFFIFSKVIYTISMLLAFAFFIYGLFSSTGAFVLGAVIACIVISFIFFVIHPSMFD